MMIALTPKDASYIATGLRTYGDTLYECIKDEALTLEERDGFRKDSDEVERLLEYFENASNNTEPDTTLTTTAEQHALDNPGHIVMVCYYSDEQRLELVCHHDDVDHWVEHRQVTEGK